MPTQRLTYLFDKYLSKSCTNAELQELSILLLAKQNDDQVNELLEGAWDKMEINAEMPEGNANDILNRILTTSPQTPLLKERSLKETSVKKLYPWKRWVAAAAILVVILSATYLLTTRNGDTQIAETKHEVKNNQDVAAPTKTKATIKLADGSLITLDEAAAGKLTQQGDVSITKTADGKIIYSGRSSEISYNTLNNPRGSLVIDMTLADGSHVWLNAGSSVTYPTAFSGKERKVSITGEAYFEVAHLSLNPSPKGEGKKGSVPFLVEANGVTVEVLGTHFNVNAYDDESEIKVTLLEGSVAVSNSTKKSIIKPGQQARLRSFGSAQDKLTQADIRILNDVDVDQVMAWKNGIFEFNNTELPVIMRQISRWYDMDIVYEGRPTNEKFGGGLSMKLPLNNALKLLEANGVKFRVEGKKVIVIY